MPSIVWETQGLMAAECLAGRVPALVPAMGGLAEQVRDGALDIAGEAAVYAGPGEGALDDPALGLDDEAGISTGRGAAAATRGPW